MICLCDLSWNQYLCRLKSICSHKKKGYFPRTISESPQVGKKFSNRQTTQHSGKGPYHPANSMPVWTVPSPSSLYGSWSQILLSNSIWLSCRQYPRWVLTEGHHWRASGRFQTAPKPRKSSTSQPERAGQHNVRFDCVGLINKGENR